MTVLRNAWIVTLALVIAGCAETEAAPQQARQTAPPSAAALTVHRHGVTVELPRGWQSATESLTPHLTDPRERLAVGTFPLSYRQTGCAHVPSSALEDMGPGDAFVTLQERGLDPAASWPDFPARPAHFGPDLGGPSEADACAPGAHVSDHWFGFSDGRRHFHVLVAFGPHPSAEVQRQAWAILDGLRVDPRVVPDWQSSG
jgi:hypothetical protein